jgi:hypothetical protein
LENMRKCYNRNSPLVTVKENTTRERESERE